VAPTGRVIGDPRPDRDQARFARNLSILKPVDYLLTGKRASKYRDFAVTRPSLGGTTCNSGMMFPPTQNGPKAARSHQNRKPGGKMGEALLGGHEMLNHLGRVIRVARRTINQQAS